MAEIFKNGSQRKMVPESTRLKDSNEFREGLYPTVVTKEQNTIQ